jgi:hypothetical protein
MESVRIVWSMGIIALAFSLDGMGNPPPGKGKPAPTGPSPFIEFPVPQRAVGVVQARDATAFGKHQLMHKEKLGRPEFEASLPMNNGSFPAPRRAVPVPECISR